MKIRKIAALGGLVATAAIAGSIAFASSANAATPNGDGSVYVSKAEVQSATHWNNADFDKNWSKIQWGGSGSVTTTNTQTWFCGDQSFVDNLSQTNSFSKVNATATPVYNAGNAKQITGFNVSNAGVAQGSSFTIGATLHSYGDGSMGAAMSDASNCRITTGAPYAPPTLTPSVYTWNLNSVTVNGTDVAITPAA